jgi:transcriptional regulator with XRE-family HTH domain
MIDRIVNLARRHDYTAETLEKAAGLAKNRISKWKDQDKQRSEPTARQLWRIAKLLDVSIGYFLGESATPKPDRPPSDPTPDRTPPDRDTALAYMMVDKLGPERAILALASALHGDRDRAAHPINGSSPEPR